MTDDAAVKNRDPKSPAPRRLIILVAFMLCLALLASGLFTFATLSRLRVYYLTHRCQEIASAIDLQVRGPGRRNNPEFWRSVFESNFETYSGSVALLALVDQNGNLLASKETEEIQSGGVYYFDHTLPRSRIAHGEGSQSTSGWRVRVGLRSAEADFIRRIAFLQLVVSGLAIAAIIALSRHLVRMLSRFMELKARESAEVQLKSLGIMAASLAHEIRNPLGAMKGLTQLAQEELPPDHAAQAQLQTVVGEAERLEKLVADLLDFARAKEPQIIEFDLANLLSDVKIMLKSRLDESKTDLRFSVDPDPFILRSDPSGLRQVLLNVLINAIEASPPGGAVALTALRRENQRSIALEVDDSGSGLGVKNPEDLFHPFVTTKVRGTGLGLTVSKQIVESLGGSLSLGNLPNGGARCSIVLPMN